MPDRLAAPSLIAELAEERHRTSFFQLVLLLLGSAPGAVAPGGEGPVSREIVRFRPSATLGFPASDVDEIEQLPPVDRDGPGRYRLTVNFMGLYGPASPMPNHFTEELLWAGSEGEQLRDFLDLFHHRMISFVFRSWEKYRPYVQHDPGTPDRSTQRALCFTGLGTSGARQALGGASSRFLRVAGLLNRRPHSAVGLAGVLHDQFEEVPVQVESFVAREVPLDDDQQMRLGRRSHSLGRELVLGDKVRDCAGSFRLSLGPLTREQFRRFLPGGAEFRRLVRTVRFYTSDPLSFSVRLTLRPEDVPALTLSPEAGLPLGQMSWLLPTRETEAEVFLSTQKEDPLWAAPSGRTEPRPPGPGPVNQERREPW
jgi:type VI secretion system protein ImpH